MKVKCGDCREVMDVPVNQQEYGLAIPDVHLWNKHGHFPGRFTLICPCGEEWETGFYVHPDVDEAAKLAERFYSKHMGHGVTGFTN